MLIVTPYSYTQTHAKYSDRHWFVGTFCVNKKGERWYQYADIITIFLIGCIRHQQCNTSEFLKGKWNGIVLFLLYFSWQRMSYDRMPRSAWCAVNFSSLPWICCSICACVCSAVCVRVSIILQCFQYIPHQGPADNLLWCTFQYLICAESFHTETSKALIWFHKHAPNLGVFCWNWLFTG